MNNQKTTLSHYINQSTGERTKRVLGCSCNEGKGISFPEEKFGWMTDEEVIGSHLTELPNGGLVEVPVDEDRFKLEEHTPSIQSELVFE